MGQRHVLVLTHACVCCCLLLSCALAAVPQLPEGDWFCSGECSVIKTQLGALVGALARWWRMALLSSTCSCCSMVGVGILGLWLGLLVTKGVGDNVLAGSSVTP